MATENLLKECLEVINERAKSELNHIRDPSRGHFLKIIEEEIRNHFPIGNFPAFPVHDFDEFECYDKKNKEPVKYNATGWNGDC